MKPSWNKLNNLLMKEFCEGNMKLRDFRGKLMKDDSTNSRVCKFKYIHKHSKLEGTYSISWTTVIDGKQYGDYELYSEEKDKRLALCSLIKTRRNFIHAIREQ